MGTETVISSTPDMSPFMRLPLHIREQIYMELLSTRRTKTMTIDGKYDYVAVLDSHYNSAVAEDLWEPVSPRITRFNFTTQLLRVNSQINREAAPILGWKNSWVLIAVSEQRMANNLAKIGSMLPLHVPWSTPLTDVVKRTAITIAICSKSVDPQIGGYQLLTDLDGLHDLLCLMAYNDHPPRQINVRINRQNFYPKSDSVGVEYEFMKRLERFRLFCRHTPSSPAMDGPLIPLEIVDGNGSSREVIDSLRTVFNEYEVLAYLRKGLTPFSKNLHSIDWKAEELSMSDWCHVFLDAQNRFGCGGENRPHVGAMWRDTMCAAHLKLAIISMGLKRRPEAKVHIKRASEMQDEPSPLIWYYRCAITYMHRYEPIIFGDVDDLFTEILEYGWCLAPSQHHRWFVWIWLWADTDERHEIEMLYGMRESMGIAREYAGNGPDALARRTKMLDHQMAVWVGMVINKVDRERRKEYNKVLEQAAEALCGETSTRHVCKKYSIPLTSVL